MKKTTAILTAIILVQVLMAFVAVLPAQAEGSAFISGSVFADTNANGMWEPGEVNLANATVHLKSNADPAVTFAVGTDAAGYYLMQNIPYGIYTAWAADAEGGMSPLRTVELGEVNAAVTTDFAVIDNSDDVEMTSVVTHRVMLPLMTR